MAERTGAQELIEHLQGENERLRQTVAGQQQILHQRAEPLLAAMVDALVVVANMADQGHPGAKHLIANWRRAHERAEQAATGILVIRDLPKNGSGS